MKVLILTTQTPHHTYFVQRIGRNYDVSVVAENSAPPPPFEIHHPFEDDRTRYENDTFFKGREIKLDEVVKDILTVSDINSPAALEFIKSRKPEVIITFGTRRIKKDLINLCKDGFINLHGGDPEQYRGLDSHLWAIYHGDFGNLVVTLHLLNEELDDGAVLLKKAVPLKKALKLYELRRFNTETCVELTLEALQQKSLHGRFSATPQRHKGRYYSYMPTVLKEVCRARFEKYCSRL